MPSKCAVGWLSLPAISSPQQAPAVPRVRQFCLLRLRLHNLELGRCSTWQQLQRHSLRVRLLPHLQRLCPLRPPSNRLVVLHSRAFARAALPLTPLTRLLRTQRWLQSICKGRGSCSARCKGGLTRHNQSWTYWTLKVGCSTTSKLRLWPECALRNNGSMVACLLFVRPRIRPLEVILCTSVKLLHWWSNGAVN